MTTRRDVQDYEAQARQVASACRHVATAEVCQRCIAAALRAEREAALQASIDACDDAIGALQGDREVEAALECIKRIRALIAPAPESPPEPDLVAGHSDAEPQPEPPHWRIGRHYGIHVYRGEVPIATFHTVEDATAAVRAYNASLDSPGAATGDEG